MSPSLFIKATDPLLFNVVPYNSIPNSLVFIPVVICFISAFLPGDFIIRILQQLLYCGYFKHILVVELIEASQIDNTDVNTLLRASVSHTKTLLVKALHMITLPKIVFHQCYFQGTQPPERLVNIMPTLVVVSCTITMYQV